MTRKLLEQYRWLAVEITNEQARLEALEQEEREGVVHDVLNDPETARETVSRIQESRAHIRQTLETGLHRAEAQCAEVEAWITRITDPHMQQCIILRFVDGLTYREIAAKVGGTPAAVRKALDRFLEAQEAQEARL